MKRTDANTLAIIQHVTGGDRCNGGVQDVDERNHQLTFSVNLTAYDFFLLANKASRNLKAYDDLAACAICCIAKAVYQVDTTLKTTLQYIDISDINSADSMPKIAYFSRDYFTRRYSLASLSKLTCHPLFQEKKIAWLFIID